MKTLNNYGKFKYSYGMNAHPKTEFSSLKMKYEDCWNYMSLSKAIVCFVINLLMNLISWRIRSQRILKTNFEL